MTKMINALVVRKVGMNLDTQFTVTEEDASRASSGLIQIGDILTVRSLLILAALPSDNLAPIVLARAIAGRVADKPAHMSAYDWGLRQMNLFLAENNMQSICINPYARTRGPMSEVRDILTMVHNDVTLRNIYNSKTETIAVGGPASRALTVEHTANAADIAGYDVRGVAKTGTGSSRYNLAIRYNVSGKNYTAVIMGARINRYQELKKAVDAIKLGAEYFNDVTPRDNYGANSFDPDTSFWDITHRCPTAVRRSDRAGIFIRRTGNVAYLRCIDMGFPYEAVYTDVLTRSMAAPFTRVPITGKIQSERLVFKDITANYPEFQPDPSTGGVAVFVGNGMVTLRFDRVKLAMPGSAQIRIAELADDLRPIGQVAGVLAPVGGGSAQPIRVATNGWIVTNATTGPVSGAVTWPIRPGNEGYVTLNGYDIQVYGPPPRDDYGSISFEASWVCNTDLSFTNGAELDGLYTVRL